MMQKVLAIICVILIVVSGALIVLKGTEGYDISVQDVTAGVATTITISNAVFSQERLEGNHNVTIEVDGKVFEEILMFVDGEATFHGIDPISEVGKYPVKVTLNDRVKFSTLNVFLYIVTDDRGKDVGFFEYPETIVSLGKSFTRMLFELDQGDKLVGVDSYSTDLKDEDSSDYHSLDQVPSLGYFSSSWDSEFIANLNPDLVIIHRYTWGAYPDLISKLEVYNINVLAYYPSSYDEVVDLVGRFGVLFNKTDSSDVLQAYMTDIKAEVTAKTLAIAENDKPKVYGELSNGNAVNIGSIMHELITICAGINLAEDPEKPVSYKIDREAVFFSLLMEDADFIILQSTHKMSNSDFRNVNKVPADVEMERLNNAYLNYDYLLAQSLIEMAEILHPGIAFDWPTKQTP